MEQIELTNKGFNNQQFVLPGPIKSGSNGHVVEFKFNKTTTEGDVEYVHPGCNCTADISVKGGQVSAVYSDSTPPGSIPKAGEENAIPITKSLYIFWRDGKPLHINNERGVQVLNWDKAHTKLTFYANVMR